VANVFRKMPITFSKKWIYFFAILQVGGLMSAFLQTGLIIYTIRKCKREILEGDYF
jgi:hypothetical protein